MKDVCLMRHIDRYSCCSALVVALFHSTVGLPGQIWRGTPGPIGRGYNTMGQAGECDFVDADITDEDDERFRRLTP